jgi:very-short-patch-repair endonuclease
VDRPVDYARTFRKRLSDSERILWYHLRREAMGVRFRRQHPVGPYVVDFGCRPLRLAVEADGWQHRGSWYHDEQRDEYLKGRGWVVMRFENQRIYEDVEGVLAEIRSWIEKLQQ